MAEVRAHVAQAARAVELARGPALAAWSSRTAERALAWAACVEDDADREGLAAVKAALRGVVLGKRKRGELPVQVDGNRLRWIAHPRKTLLVAMAESAHATDKIRAWVASRAAALGPAASAEVEAALARGRQTMAQEDSSGDRRGDDAEEKVEGGLVLDEIVGSAAFREAWKDREDPASLQTLALAALESFARQEEAGADIKQKEKQKNEDGAHEWVLARLRASAPALWAGTRHALVLQVAKRDFGLATRILSHIIVQAQAAHALMGTPDLLVPAFAQFCEAAPWMCLFCEDALAASTEAFAVALRSAIGARSTITS